MDSNSNILTFSLFVIVGLANTLLDFIAFNLLTGKRLNMPRVPANWISTSLGMCFSFAANSIIVFPGSEGRLAWRLLAFFATNATSMYVVQTTVLWLGLHLFPYPIKRLAEGVCNRFGARFDSDLLRRNLVKALATGASMLYNYCSYILWVFR